MQHFKDLLTEDDKEAVLECETQEEDTDVPTMEEIKEIINRSRNGKAPGKDKINIELIKYGGEKLQESIGRLIQKSWREEKMPKDWETGTIVTLHKKGDQQLCKNYRGISLLSTVYKTLSTLIQKRLSEKLSGKIGQYQCGFIRGRSTTDAIHTIKHVIEKAREHKMEIDLLFIDFKQAFDSLKRKELIKALEESGINEKLKRLIVMTMNNNTISIKTPRGKTEEFRINKGVRQGDALSATLFNIAIEQITKKINKGNLRTGGGQIIAYADDIVIMAKNRSITKKMLEEIADKGEKIGLRINEEKTKIMTIGRQTGKVSIKIGRYKIEEVETFKYLGIMISKTGSNQDEITEKILAANRAFHANKHLLKNKILTKKTKMKIYKTTIRPIILYSAETMTITKKEEEDLKIMERKILRTILGPVKVGDNEYRSRMNHELRQELGEDDIAKKIKTQRIQWLGHVWRAGPKAMIRSVVEWSPGGRRRRGRPHTKWLSEVENDLRKIGVKKWQEKTADRKKWKEILQRYKIHPHT